MNKYAVQLQNTKTIIVPEFWIQHKNPKRWTKIFRSEDLNKTPNFSLPAKYFLTRNDACYHGLCLKKIGKYILKKLGKNYIN